MSTAPIEDLRVKAEALYWKRVKLAREHFPTYAEMVVKDENGQAITYSAIHHAWCAHVDYCWARGKHAMILSPFGHGKSSGFAVPLSTWLIGRNVQTRIKFVSNGDEFATQRVLGAQQILESHEYADVFPGVVRGRKWTHHAVYVRRLGASLDPTLHARGVETKGIGGRADYLFFDDVVDQINSAEERQRTKIKQRVKATWMSRLDPDHGLALWIATPWHVDDATYEMMAQADWCTLIVRVRKGGMHYEVEVVNAGPDYPTLAAAA